MNKYKLKSYTIIEVLISMLIMSVVVLITYVLFSSLMQQLLFFKETEETLLEYNFFKNTLKREVFESKEVTFKSNNIISLSYENREINYFFNKKIVLREDKYNNCVDTFFVEIKRITPFFIPNLEKKTLSSIKIEIIFFEEETTVLLTKEYGKDIFINNFFDYEN